MFKLGLKLGIRLRRPFLKARAERISEQVKDSGVLLSAGWIILKLFVLLFFGGVVLFPFFFFITQAVTPTSEWLAEGSKIVPSGGWAWSNFKAAFEGSFGGGFNNGYLRAALITIAVTALTVTLRLVMTMAMGYGFAYRKFWGKRVIWALLIALLAMPEMGLLSGQFTMATQLQLREGSTVILTMALPFVAHVFTAFMFRNAFAAIPNRIKEAALVDGSSELRYFWKVALPMVAPTTWTVVITTAIQTWNSYLWPLQIASQRQGFLKPLGIWLYQDTGIIEDQTGASITLLNIRMAAAVLVMLPLFAIYFAFRSRIMRAISRQGLTIKG